MKVGVFPFMKNKESMFRAGLISPDTFKLSELIDEAVKDLRRGHRGYANRNFAYVIAYLVNLTEELSKEKVVQLLPILDVMEDAQKRQDMLYVADILQYEIPRVLNSSETKF